MAEPRFWSKLSHFTLQLPAIIKMLNFSPIMLAILVIFMEKLIMTLQKGEMIKLNTFNVKHIQCLVSK